MRIETFESAPVPSRQIMPAPMPPSGYATRDKFSFSYLIKPPVCEAGFLDVDPILPGSAAARRLALLPTPATPATWIPAFRKSLRFQPVCFISKAPEVLSYPRRFATLHSSMPNTVHTFRRLAQVFWRTEGEQGSEFRQHGVLRCSNQQKNCSSKAVEAVQQIDKLR